MIMSNKEKTKIEKIMIVAVCAGLMITVTSCQPDDWVKIYVPEQEEKTVEKNTVEELALQSDASLPAIDSLYMPEMNTNI